MTEYKTWMQWPGDIITDETTTTITRVYEFALRDLQKRYAGVEAILMATRQKEGFPKETIKQINMWR